MRYPVVNLVQMGGLLEDYQKENDAFKGKLDKMNQEARAKEEAARAGQPVYRPPTLTPNVTEGPYDPCPKGYTRSQSYPFNCLKDVLTPNPYTFKPGMRPMKPGFTPEGPTVPVSVATGGGTARAWGDEPTPPVFEVPERGQQPCDPGYTRSTSPPYNCLKDVSSNDRVIPPPAVPAPTSMVQPQGGGGQVNSQYSWNSLPGVPQPTAGASVDCGPGKFWDGRECRGSVGSMPGGIPGDAGGVAASSQVLGEVPLHPEALRQMLPFFTRPIRVVGGW